MDTDTKMGVDESMVAFWNWTRISLAMEENDDEKDISDNNEDTATLVITVCGIVGALLIIGAMYRLGLI